MMPKKPINKNQGGGEWIEVRFMVLISGFNIWWGITCLVAKLIAEEEKCKFTHP